jgi:hypothetical protein
MALSRQLPGESEDNHEFRPFMIAGISQNGIDWMRDRILGFISQQKYDVFLRHHVQTGSKLKALGTWTWSFIYVGESNKNWDKNSKYRAIVP